PSTALVRNPDQAGVFVVTDPSGHNGKRAGDLARGFQGDDTQIRKNILYFGGISNNGLVSPGIVTLLHITRRLFLAFTKACWFK
ncbi:hypothetical protein BGZ74_003007, partial [Mortierella antarctica]